MGGDKDGDSGPLLSPECIGYRDYTGGGQPPPPTVPPVRHDGALAGAEHTAYHHLSVSQGGVEKEMANFRRGSERECGEGLSGL